MKCIVDTNLYTVNVTKFIQDYKCLMTALPINKYFCNIKRSILHSKAFISSPEPKAPGELIVKAGSVVRRPSTISNDFSETTGPIATKFHIQPPGPLGKKSCSTGLGHMTSMAAIPIYGKNLKKSSSPEPIDQ